MDPLRIIVLCILGSAVILGVIAICIVLFAYTKCSTLKRLCKKGKDIDPYDIKGDPKEEKLLEILTKYGYKLKTIRKQEVKPVKGLGKVEYRNGDKAYHVYTSSCCYSIISEKTYKSLKKKLAEVDDVTAVTITYISDEEMYVKE